MLQLCFNWDHISVIAGMHYRGVCFRLHEGSIAKEEVLAFVKALKVHYRGPLLIVWDGAKPHRARIVREYVDSTEGHIHIAFLPGYAAELNPVEYLWSWLKRHALASFCPETLTELQHAARGKLKSAQRRSASVAACWQQAELF